MPDDDLEEINRLWTIVRAFANTAHDMNNALQVIAGSAELLAARQLDEAVQRRVQTIRSEAERAATALNHLLSYARASDAAGAAVDLRALVETAVAMRAASANRARIALRLERSAADACWAKVDRHRTLQALLDVLLAAEEVVKGLTGARIHVQVRPAATGIEVSIAAAGDGRLNLEGEATPKTTSLSVAMTSGAQLWTAARVIGAQGGTLSIASGAEGHTVIISVPRIAATRDQELGAS